MEPEKVAGETANIATGEPSTTQGDVKATPSVEVGEDMSEYKILETVDDIQERRDTVLGKYVLFKADARDKRNKLEDSKRFQYFKRDADELEVWILDKLNYLQQEELLKLDASSLNLPAKIQKHQAFEAEVLSHAEAIDILDKDGSDMVLHSHFASENIKVSSCFKFPEIFQHFLIQNS